MFVGGWASCVTLALAALVLPGCAPALDWREVRPAGSQVEMSFPCKPHAQQRQVRLAGQTVRLELHACSAAGQTWGLAFADVADPLQLTHALVALRDSAAANIAADAATRSVPLQIPGATPNAASQRTWLTGKLPDGKAVSMQVVVFTYGTRVLQATALGESLSDEAADIFFGAIRVRP